MVSRSLLVITLYSVVGALVTENITPPPTPITPPPGLVTENPSEEPAPDKTNNQHQAHGKTIVDQLNKIHGMQEAYISSLVSHRDEEVEKADSVYKNDVQKAEDLVTKASEAKYSAQTALNKAYQDQRTAETQFNTATTTYEELTGEYEAANKAWKTALSTKGFDLAAAKIKKSTRTAAADSTMKTNSQKACRTMVLLKTIFDVVKNLTHTSEDLGYTDACVKCESDTEHCNKAHFETYISKSTSYS